MIKKSILKIEDHNQVVLDIGSIPFLGCVFLLINESKKLVYVSYTQNDLVSCIRRIQASQPRIRKDWKQLKVIIVEWFNSYDHFRRCELVGWAMSYYKQLGYKMYNSPKGLKLRLVENIEYTTKLYTDCPGKNLILKLYLVDSNKNSVLLVGVFGSASEMDEFKANYYPKGTFWFPVYANNRLTRIFNIEEADRLSQSPKQVFADDI